MNAILYAAFCLYLVIILAMVFVLAGREQRDEDERGWCPRCGHINHEDLCGEWCDSIDAHHGRPCGCSS